MARTAEETANILSDLYDENFRNESYEAFRITWPQLRSLAAVPCLNDKFLKEVSDILIESKYCLIPFNDFLFIAEEQDLSQYRMVPDRILEKYLPDSEGLKAEVAEGDEDIEV
jgi:hypothetical protein